MLTAAVRDLKGALGAGVEIDVRTPCPALWEQNPHLTPLVDGAGELIECHDPLIHQSNTGRGISSTAPRAGTGGVPGGPPQKPSR